MMKSKIKAEYDSKRENIYNLDHLQIDEKNRSALYTTIKEVKEEFGKLLVKRNELIKRLGNAFESVVSNPGIICRKIKNSLQEEIKDKIISARDIERHCPDKWKKKTKQQKNDKLSLSEQVIGNPQQQTVATQEGKLGVINETSSNTDDVNQLQDQNGISGSNGTQLTATNQCKSLSCNKPDVRTESSSINNAGTVQTLSHTWDTQIGSLEAQTSMQTADENPVIEFKFTIPKEEYGMVKDAMDKSKASISLKFDGNKKFLGADPDVFDNSEQKMKIQNPVKRPRTSNLRSKE
jgi:hypothetical protein